MCFSCSFNSWNALAYPAFAKSWLFCMETMSVVLTSVANHADPNDPVAVEQAATTSDWAIPYLEPDEDPNEPFADMYYPVIDAIDDVLIKVTNKTEALGVVAFSFYWRHTLKHILPEKSRGIVIVFQNPCGNQSFTYQIDGDEPNFLGFGDLHEEQFDDMSVTRKLFGLTNRDGLYTGRPMTTDFCPYSLSIYPSSIMEAKHLTKDPVIYTVVVALIFLFTSALFLAYDLFVNRRQRLVKQRALASGAIVSSLFPDQVRNQLYEDNEKQNIRKNASPGAEFLAMSASLDGSELGRPNAHLYENTSVFFADIVGFTSWSHSRTPVEVFQLLEALCKFAMVSCYCASCIYISHPVVLSKLTDGAFDKLAVRRGVFKVETIGYELLLLNGMLK